MISSTPLRIGVLGLGMAGGVMISALKRHRGVTLTAAADIDPDLRNRFSATHDLPAHADAKSLFSQSDVDAIYVATPHQMHAGHAIEAARHGKHIVVEKPMSLSIADCDAMIEAAKGNGVQMIVGHTHGFDPAITAIRQISSRPDIGAPRFIAALNYTNFLYRPRRPEELVEAQGGGALWNQVPHQIDMIRSIMDQPIRSVTARLFRLDRARPVPALCAAFLEFEDGAAAQLTYGGYDRFDSDEWAGWIGEVGHSRSPAHGAACKALSSTTDERTVRKDTMSFGGAAFQNLRFAAHPHFGEMIVSCDHADLRPSANGVAIYNAEGFSEVTLPRLSDWPGHCAVWDELLAAITGRPPLHDGHFGRATVQVCLAIEASARQNRQIQISELSS